MSEVENGPFGAAGHRCGDPVTDADHPSAEYVGKSIAIVELSFGKSSSRNYDQAIEICRNTPSYTESGEGKQLRHTARLPITEIELILNLHKLVGGWKSSRLLINKQPATGPSCPIKCNSLLLTTVSTTAFSTGLIATP